MKWKKNFKAMFTNRIKGTAQSKLQLLMNPNFKCFNAAGNQISQDISQSFKSLDFILVSIISTNFLLLIVESYLVTG